MLRIILGILKLIGILLAAVLLLVLGILLIVLLTPVRYRGTVEKTSERTRANACVSWFFRFISVAYSFDLREKQQELIIRICGMRLTSIIDFFKKIADGRKRKGSDRKKEVFDDIPDVPDTPAVPEQVEEPEIQADIDADTGLPGEADTVEEPDIAEKTGSAVVPESLPEDNISKDINSESEVFRQNSPKKKMPKKKAPKKKAAKQKSSGQSSDSGEKKSFSEKLQELYTMMNDKIHGLEQLQEKISAIPDKVSGYLDMIEEYEVKAVLGDVLHEVFALLKRYLPRKMTGYLHFGLADPSATGKLTGLLYILLPSGASGFRIEPEFNQTVFETEVTLSGRIRPCHVLIMLVRLLLNRKLIRLIKKVLSLRSKNRKKTV